MHNPTPKHRCSLLIICTPKEAKLLNHGEVHMGHVRFQSLNYYKIFYVPERNLYQKLSFHNVKYCVCVCQIWSTCTSTSCAPTDFIRIEKRDRSTLGRRVASARRIATDMIPSITANPFSTCFLKMHRQKNSAKNHHLLRNLNQIFFTLCSMFGHKHMQCYSNAWERINENFQRPYNQSWTLETITFILRMEIALLRNHGNMTNNYHPPSNSSLKYIKEDL